MKKTALSEAMCGRAVAALVPLATLALGLGFASISLAQNAITDWHAVMETTVAATGRKNVVALPYFAYVDVAMYDAVNSINGGCTPYLMKVSAPQVGEFEQTSELRDYREVDGVKVPFQVTATSSVQTINIAVAKVEHNASVDETLFAKPKQD